MILLLAIPLAVCAYSYGIYTLWEYEYDTLFMIGFLPAAFAVYYIAATTIVLLILEWKYRRKNEHRRITPPFWLSLICIILPAAVSIAACFVVIAPWANAIASV